MDDASIHDEINALAEEEKQLREQLAGSAATGAEHARLTEIEVKRDQLWDLLRQREAKVDAGEDPDEATLRPAAEVEGYQQ